MSEPAPKLKNSVIRVLPELVINQIAAGEVVDRPAAVVRELIDNAIDAGADDITVYLEEGGHCLIRVVDNGGGMGRDDAILAFERHATSKISSSSDLNNLSTLGFRGEALPSIASVSQLRLKTKRFDDELGTEVVIWGGKIKGVTALSAPNGTDIEVGKLFFNTPARRKFLRQAGTEEQRVKLWMQHAALPFPKLRYRLFASGREVLNLAPSVFIERCREIIRGSAVEIGFAAEGIEITGLIGHPALAATGAEAQVIILNGRIIKDRSLSKAIREGFDSTLKSGEIPAAVINLRLDPGEVDVNVHPQKSEVRFRSPQKVFQLVREAVRSGVLRFKSPFSTLPSLSSTPFSTFKAADTYDSGFGVRESSNKILNYQPQLDLNTAVSHSTGQVAETDQNLFCDGGFNFSDLNYIGQALGCYLMCELREKIYIVDMHAAHERINFNIMRNKFTLEKLPSQQLLLPLSVELSPQAFSNCTEHLDVFSRFGFEVEAFGDKTVIVRSHPTLFKDGDLKALILEVASVPLEGVADGRFAERIDHIAARIACHASIRSGRIMERDEVYALFRALDSAEFSAACPHGRPVIVPFTRREIEQWFGRDR